MRVFKTKLFSRRAKDMGLDDSALFNAAREISQGSFEANLGGNIYKKRIALGNRGKSGGARTIVAFKIKDKAIFLYGFPKNEGTRKRGIQFQSNALRILKTGFSDAH